MCSRGLVRLLLLFGAVVPRAAAEEAALQVPSELADRTRGAWIEIYGSWLELPNGNALPFRPGPAFCVGSDGFAVVDQNAVARTVHLFATILGHGPYAARARAFDAEAGIAAVQLNPGVLAGPLPMVMRNGGACRPPCPRRSLTTRTGSWKPTPMARPS